MGLLPDFGQIVCTNNSCCGWHTRKWRCLCRLFKRNTKDYLSNKIGTIWSRYAPPPINPTHTKARSRPMQYGPVPHLWACTERTDVKSSCFTLWFSAFLPSSWTWLSLLQFKPDGSCDDRDKGDATKMSGGDSMPWTRCARVTGRHDDVRIQWPLFLQEIFGRLRQYSTQWRK